MIKSRQIKYKPPVTITGDYTILETDDDIICNGSGAIALTLPAASSGNAGRKLRIKTIADQAVNSASSNIAPIDSATAGTAILPAYKGSWAEIVSNGSNWVMMTYLPANLLLY